MDFTNKNVIITGGASGIGKAVTTGVVAGGGHAIIVDLNLEAAQNVCKELGEENATAYQANMGDSENIRTVFGKILEDFKIIQSYLLIEDIEEQIEIGIDFEVSAKFVRANPNVREDAGKVALVKGPLVYCLEETDNGKNLPSIFVDTKQELQETFESELLGGVTTIRFTGKKLNMDTWQDGALYDAREQVLENVELKAIPYHCWDNRKTGEMLVWMKEMF